MVGEGFIQGAASLFHYVPVETGSGATRYNEQLHYAFDAAGNLQYRTNNTLVENFLVNSVNELTQNTNGGRMTVMGTATSSNSTTVTVNGTNAFVYGDATFAATNMPLTTSYTAVAADSYGRHSTNAVTVSLSTNNAAYQYDGNGNLTNDGTRSFAYDDENQLIQVWVTSNWFRNSPMMPRCAAGFARNTLGKADNGFKPTRSVTCTTATPLSKSAISTTCRRPHIQEALTSLAAYKVQAGLAGCWR